MKELLNKLKENRSLLDTIFILIVAIILSIPLFNKNLNLYLNDGGDNLVRAYETYQSIKQNGSGNIISEFTNKFGYSWKLFNGEFSTYILIIFGIIFGSFNVGFKISFFLIIFLSGISMYKLINEISQNKNTALLSSVIYISAPYFFTNIYVRYAISDSMCFIFIPMVFLGLYNLLNTEKNHYYLIFGLARFNYYE